jgi:potassium/chloride transporter 9
MVVVSFFIQDPLRVLIPKTNIFAYNNEPFLYNKTDYLYGQYTGFSSATFKGNMYSNYTIDYTTGDTMNFATVFGILFSTITGLLAGANMSGMSCSKSISMDYISVVLGELQQPSRSIPMGSFCAVVFVFFVYVTETLLIAATTDRFVKTLSFSSE